MNKEDFNKILKPLYDLQEDVVKNFWTYKYTPKQKIQIFAYLESDKERLNMLVNKYLPDLYNEKCDQVDKFRLAHGLEVQEKAYKLKEKYERKKDWRECDCKKECKKLDCALIKCKKKSAAK